MPYDALHAPDAMKPLRMFALPPATAPHSVTFVLVQLFGGGAALAVETGVTILLRAFQACFILTGSRSLAACGARLISSTRFITRAPSAP